MLAEFRDALQEVVTPDLKALQEKVAGLDKTIDARLGAFSSSIEAQNIALTANKGELMAKIDQLLTLVQSNHNSILQSLNLDKRLEAVEARQSAPVAVQGYLRAAPLTAAEQYVIAEPLAIEAAYPEAQAAAQAEAEAAGA